MPDIETLDRVLDIITRVPHLHEQYYLVSSVDDPDAARRELAGAPDVQQLLPPADAEWPTHSCGSAYCFGGWTLLVKGYTERSELFFPPGVDPELGDWAVSDPLAVAEQLLGIDLDVLGDCAEDVPTLFHHSTTLSEIKAWVAFYKGEIDTDTLRTLLGLYEQEPA